MKQIIAVENLGKKYIIGHQKQKTYKTFRDTISLQAKSIYQRLRYPLSPNSEQLDIEEFWALKDINFKVHQGDRIGIIGRNGAGKSTLLKILSRITHPTTGRIHIKGKVASLLEVGTGFHPELTGRENIFLNGAILGMTRRDIKKRFDEIVDFAEIDKFLDTPVKRYSSGMYIRLAFAVAAHLEPEILVVDEVLAVGDAQFQKKCLGKMNTIGKDGRTILFVSHNMQAIKQLCSTAFLLQKGELIQKGSCSKAIKTYLNSERSFSSDFEVKKVIEESDLDPVFKLISINLFQNGYQIDTTIENGHSLDIEIQYKIKKKISGLRVFVDIVDDYDLLLFRSFHDEDNNNIPIMGPAVYKSSTSIPADTLGPASYVLKIHAGIHNIRNIFSLSFPIKVENTSRYNRAYLGDTFRGKLAFHIPWETRELVDFNEEI